METTSGIEQIMRLRRAERMTDEPLSAELRAVRAFVEEAIGPTITRAQAARLLGVSQTALDRWIRKGEISAVLTPEGRREVPLSELVDLLEELEPARSQGGKRPLAAAIRERHRRSSQTIDLNRLVPRRGRRGHKAAELHSLAYHRLTAERLNKRIVDDARRRLRAWRDDGRIDPRWAAEWDRILAMPMSGISKAISEDTKRARELRQTSPFAGNLTEQERRRLTQAVEERVLA